MFSFSLTRRPLLGQPHILHISQNAVKGRPLRIANRTNGYFSTTATALKAPTRAARQASAKARAPSSHAIKTDGPRKLAESTAATGGASYNPLIQQLANRPSPILIYQGESKGPYVTGCFALGATCVAYALINGNTILFDPMVDPSTFVKVTFGFVCTAMLGFGCAAFYKTFRIVRSVTVVPTALRNGQRSVHLRIEYGSLRSKTIDVPYDAVSTSKRLFVAPTALSANDQLRKIHQAKDRHEWERQRILTLPFRQAGHWIRRGFLAFRRVLSDDGWIYLRIKGRRSRWKLHEKPAWALRGGKHLDDLTKRL